MTYKLERDLTEPTKVQPDAGIPGDWRIELVGRLSDGTPHFIAIQFGSKNFGKMAAKGLVAKILTAINGEP